MRVASNPDVVEMVRLVILISCKWTEDLLDKFTRPFDGALVGEAIYIGGT